MSAYAGDIGVVFNVTLIDPNGAELDLSAADTLQILLTKPDGTVLTKTATNPSGGRLRYASQSGDLSVGGVWRIHGKAVDTGVYTYTSRSSEFYVNG
jgi:hypothetical protein